MQRIRTFFHRPPSDRLFWMAWAILFKGVFFLYLFCRPNDSKIPGFLGSELGDSRWYIQPVDLLFSTGHYTPGFRMPGYSALYFPFRLMGGSTAAGANGLVIFQGLLAALGLYLLSLLAFRLTQSASMFRWTFFLYGFSTFANVFDAHLLTESFSTFLIILAAFLLEKALRNRSLGAALLTGVAIAWLVFCKPFYLPLLPFAAILVLLPRRGDAAWRPRLALLVALPFLVADTAWALAHYRHHGKLVFLQPSQYYPDDPEMLFRNPLLRFVTSWGGNDVAWYPDAEINYFLLHNREIMHYPQPALPDNIYTSVFTPETADSIALRITRLFKGYYPDAATHHAADSGLAADLDRYAQSVRKERPMLFYVTGRLKHLRDYHVHAGSKDLLPASGYAFLLIKWAQRTYYVLSILICLATAGWFVLRKKRPGRAALFPIVAVLHTWLTPPLLLGYSEIRYLTPVYPFAVLCAAFGVWVFRERTRAAGPA